MILTSSSRAAFFIIFIALCACDSERSGKSTANSKDSPHTSKTTPSRTFKTQKEEEPLFTRAAANASERSGALDRGYIHPDLPGEGNHTLDAAQAKLCFEAITGTPLPPEAEFISGRMMRKYSFTKERNPIRNSFGDGEVSFRIPRGVVGPLLVNVVAEANRMDARGVELEWHQWEGKKDQNGNPEIVADPPLDGNTSCRYYVNLSDDVRAIYQFIYDSEKEVFRIEYDYDNTRD